jgi:subtilisin family serine protease
VLIEKALPEPRRIRQTPPLKVEELISDAIAAARTEAPRASLEALVAAVNSGPFEGAANGPYLGAIVALKPTDLIFYPPQSGSESVVAQRGYSDFLRGIRRLEARKGRGAPVIVEKTVYFSDRNGSIPADRGQDTEAYANCDRGWALSHLRYDDAIASLAAPPGTGVTIAHLDTGYSDHCEFFANDGTTPLDPSSGYDFFIGADDPRDPLKPNDGVIFHGGHGTGTGSVMYSPHTSKCGLPAHPDVRGIAPAATVVPVRVTNGIVLGLPSLAQDLIGSGLFDARIVALSAGVLESSRAHSSWVKKQADVVSISMGGQCRDGDWQTGLLRCAIRQAESRGVIVVAAAGQYPFGTSILNFGKKPVCFPGRFAGAVAIAGSTILGERWDISGRGSEVAVSAPSEWVYRARKDDAGNDDWGLGAGTSFGTALTAGLAALWVQKWGGSAHLRQDYGQALTSAFVLALQNAVRDPASICDSLPDGTCYKDECSRKAWPAYNWGPGIVDAAALLTNSLTPPKDVCTWIAAHRPVDASRLCVNGLPAPVQEIDCSVPSAVGGLSNTSSRER